LGALRKLPQVEVLLGAGDGKVDEVIADGAVSALVGLMKKRLSLEERRIFVTPHRQLAEALGHGLQAISAQKPLVLLLDTYEIVDRLACDRISLDIHFVVQQIAAMRQQGIDLATILSAPSADRDDESPRELVVRATSDRFLWYCLNERDKKAVYAMAMMRRSDNDLLKAMLGVTDLEPEM
jgi:hypothetical protein